MTSAIGSTMNATYVPPSTVMSQAKAQRMDSDGDHDNSKTGEVEKTSATNSTIGSVINTTA